MINIFKYYPANPEVYSVKSIPINNINPFAFYGGCLGWDGEKYNIYFSPSHGAGSQIAQFNPDSPDLIFHGPPLSTSGYATGSIIRHFSNKIVCSPHNYNNIIVFDPVTKITNIIETGVSGGTLWGTPVLAPNGFIYCPPFSNTNILKIDVDNLSFELIETGIGGGSYFSSVLGSNGKIYFPPRLGTRVMELDPNTNTFSLVGPTLPSSYFWYGGALSYNGKIYCAPLTAPRPLVIETNPLNIYLLDTNNLSTLITNYNGIRVLPNQDILMSPVSNLRLYKIRDDKAFRFGPLISDVTNFIITNHYYTSSVIHPNGKLYLIPFGARNILEISNIGEVTPEMYELPQPEDLATSLYNIHQNNL